MLSFLVLGFGCCVVFVTIWLFFGSDCFRLFAFGFGCDFSCCECVCCYFVVWVRWLLLLL